MPSKRQKVPKRQRTTTRVEFPEQIQPFIGPAAQQLSSAFGQATPFGPSAVAGFAPEQEEAFRLQTALARGPESPLFGAAEEQILGTLGGDFLPGGEQFGQAAEAIQRRILPGITSQFSAGAALGVPAASQAITDALTTGLINPERQRQLAAAQAAPGLANLGTLQRAQLLGGVGAQRQALSQQLAAEEQARARFPTQEAQRRALQQFQALTAVPTGQTQITRGTQQQFTNPLLQGLGFGITGLGLGLGAPGALGLGALGAIGGLL